VQFDWDPKKNDSLKTTRNVCFETIIVHLGRGNLWRVAEHPNQDNYSGQKLFFVPIDDYIYIIPFEERGEVIWLVTIIPSRKATKMYLEEINNETE
jgi:uncharacterized DUF497 family protein